ncbi:hypothetical protein NPIL_145211, partial [Nephila pilipes]
MYDFSTKTWTPVQVIYKSKNLRSYIVQNTCFWSISNIPLKTRKETDFEMTETSRTQPVTSNVPQMQQKESRTQRRLGQLVTKPKFLNDYICNNLQSGG